MILTDRKADHHDQSAYLRRGCDLDRQPGHRDQRFPHYDQPDQAGYYARSWLEVWAPLQPTAAERQMHPEVIAADDDRVVVRWHQRGRSPAGLGFDGQVLGLYEVREERLARAQMFYVDTDAVKRFLDDAAGQRPESRSSEPPAPGR